MKTITTIMMIIGWTFTLSLSAQETETRDLGSFDGISVSAGVDALLVKGNENKIEITASGIDLDRVKTSIKRNVLKVGVDHKKWWASLGKRNKRKVQVTITYDAALDYISSSSGSFVEADHTIASNSLHLKTSSGADMSLDIDANNLEVDVSSGAHMDLAGDARDVEIDLSSGSSLDAYDLEAENVEVDGSSGATAKVNVSNSLNADVSSGASVKYKGNPSQKDIDKSSGGSVRQS